MPDSVRVRDLIPPDLLTTPDPGRRHRPLLELADHTHDELRQAGLTPSAAQRLLCALELGHRLHHAPLRPGVLLRSSRRIFEAYEPQHLNT